MGISEKIIAVGGEIKWPESNEILSCLPCVVTAGVTLMHTKSADARARVCMCLLSRGAIKVIRK